MKTRYPQMTPQRHLAFAAILKADGWTWSDRLGAWERDGDAGWVFFHTMEDRVWLQAHAGRLYERPISTL